MTEYSHSSISLAYLYYYKSTLYNSTKISESGTDVSSLLIC